MSRWLQSAFGLILLGIVLFLTFNRGGFFAYEAMPGAAAVLLLFTLAFGQVKTITGRSQLVMAVAALWLAVWFLSLSQAVQIGLALEELLRNAMYVSAFLLVYLGIRAEKIRKAAVGLLIITGVMEALAGLGTAYGTFSFASAYNPDLRRVMGTMQYPNALAGYLSMIFIMGIYMASDFNSRWWRASIAVANYLLFTGILSAQSRGATLVLLLVLVPALTLWPRPQRFQVFVQSLLAVVLAFLTARWTVDFSGQIGEGLHWLGLLAGSGLAAVFASISLPDNWQERLARSGRILGLAGVVLLVIGGGWLLLRSGGLLERLAQIDWQDRNVQERLVFYQDGLKMLQDYPLTGAGGGGWRTLFEKYQSYRYVSRETHSYPLKVQVETGILGFGAYLLVFGGFFALSLRQWWRAKRLPPLAWAGMSAVLLVTLHSFIDFTLSLSAITLTMWCIMGLTLAELEEGAPTVPANRIWTWTGSAIALVLMILALRLSLGEMALRQAQQAGRSQDLNLALARTNQAIDYNGWKAAYWQDKFGYTIALAQQQNNPALLAEAVQAARRAVELDPFSPNHRLNYGKALFFTGQIESGLAELEKLTELAPYDIRTWEVLTEAYHNVARYYQQQGETAKAEAYRAKMLEVPRRMEKVWQQVPEKYRRLWNAGPKLEVTDYMKKLLAE